MNLFDNTVRSIHTLIMLTLLVLVISVSVLAIDIPLFYVDPIVLKLASRRFECFRGGSANAELAILRQESASEFFRSHELYAHSFFVEATNNPHKVQSLNEAEFEYIPLMPLNWRVDSATDCKYSSLIEDILKIQAYVEDRDKKLTAGNVRPKFSVSTAYNMRTAMGWGMPTQFRKGEVYQNVTNFVMSLSIGHYERYPQCPDLLRKSWKYVVEIPFVPMHAKVPGSNSQEKALASMDSVNKDRKYMFHFSGNFALYGCEMVCSVRNAVINLNTRADTLIINTTVADSTTGVRRVLQLGVEQSTFCIVTKGDSYSTSFFYHAIAAGCIPVVISDWFTFSYPWIVPYELFTLRVAEVDFLKNPQQVVDHIKTTFGQNPKLLAIMRENMMKFKGLLSFDGIAYQSDQYNALMSNDLYSGAKSKLPTPPSSAGFITNLPMELLLLELRYAQVEYKYYNGLPCYRPHMCHHDRANGSLSKDHIFYARKGNKDGVYSFSPINRYHGSSASKAVAIPTPATADAGGELSYNLVDGWLQVNYLHFPSLEDTRSHMCRHSGRLIGHYKIVFFMQCVRILWPLQPGQFKPVDNANRFDPDKRTGKESPTLGINEVEYNYVRAFHSINRSSDWVLNNYPVTNDLKRLYTLKQAELLIT